MARKVTLGVLAAVFTPLMASCVGAPATTYELQEPKECPIDESSYDGAVRIGYQVIPGSALFLRDQGLVESCFPHANVSWVRFATGQDVVQGFASGSIDVGIAGSPPAANALSSPIDLDLKVIRTNDITDSGEALVARDATSIEELAGENIVTAANSTAHYSLLKALEAAGITDAEITFLSPEALLSAWTAGDVDAAFMWGPTLSHMQQEGNTLTTAGEVAEETGAATHLFTLATSELVDNSDIHAVWNELEDHALDVWNEDSERFVQATSVQAGLDAELTRELIEGKKHLYQKEAEDMAEEIRSNLFETAEFLDQQGIADVKEQDHYDEAVIG
ncbi:taurine ABC transporter substrate-binding protein [Corynebacterium yudongzhengii]|uniref:Taurine ABC transporter substrate-binding protein n=1 Tax=Corynebacterium yudongzhengii TaxID=2080740 RepID=A0A2U1T671_9CORY|nr:glycine betaine ABC transporter substrate-binding protein [Corynebacterium yudongzhengii]PWC01465.1 taurine ABC transporter substrate-binding protein [Corynebacterium yudongzhengii]